jgi:hypothetical protein
MATIQPAYLDFDVPLAGPAAQPTYLDFDLNNAIGRQAWGITTPLDDAPPPMV